MNTGSSLRAVESSRADLMSYAIDWARSIYANHAISNPRGGEIIAAIQHDLELFTRRKYSELEVKRIMVASIQGRVDPAIWRHYKSAVKQGLGVFELRNSLSCEVYNVVRDEVAQYSLEF